MSESQFISILDAIYEAGLEPDHWPVAMDRITRYMGAQRAIVGYSNIEAECAEVLTIHNFDEDLFLNRWVGDFGLHDPWSHRGHLVEEGDVAAGSSLVPLEELRAQPLYHEVLEPLGVEDCLCAFLAKRSNLVSYFVVYNDREHGTFDRSDVARFAPFAPHLQRAARIHARMTAMDRSMKAAEGAFNLLPHGAIAVDTTRRILAFNRAAERMFQRAEGVASTFGRVRATRLEDDHLLGAAIRRAGETSAHVSTAGGATLTLWREPPQRPLNAIVAPLSEKSAVLDLEADVRERCVLLLISDPDIEPAPPVDRIAGTFGLTPSEARIAVAVANGATLREFADEADISIETARFHMKNALAKTGCRRQSDLVRLILTSVVGLEIG